MDIGIDEKLSLLKKMLLIRVFEEKAETLFQQKLIPGFVHLSIGQEASTAGSCAALRPDDYIISTHRGHAHRLVIFIKNQALEQGLVCHVDQPCRC